jgi:uncharacterized protein YndB with AHSA1/START domain
MLDYIGAMVSTTIAAPPDHLWAIISDVTRHPELAGSGEVMQTELLTPEPLRKGSRFQSRQNVRGLRYTTVSHVVACDPPRRLAWRIGLPGTPPFGQVWQFELIPEGQSTRVEHGVALVYVVPRLWPLTIGTDMVAQGEAQAMRPTLVNLAQGAGAEAPTSFETRLQPPPSAAALLPSPLLQGSLWVAGPALLGALLARPRGKQEDGETK